jgi:hypothetical protein
VDKKQPLSLLKHVCPPYLKPFASVSTNVHVAASYLAATIHLVSVSTWKKKERKKNPISLCSNPDITLCSDLDLKPTGPYQKLLLCNRCGHVSPLVSKERVQAAPKTKKIKKINARSASSPPPPFYMPLRLGRMKMSTAFRLRGGPEPAVACC